MAISDSYHNASVANATNTTKVAPATEIPDNCNTIMFYNPDPANDVYVAIGTAGAGALNVSVSTVIPPKGSSSMVIGVKSDRPNPSALLVYSTSAGTINVNITYLSSTLV